MSKAVFNTDKISRRYAVIAVLLVILTAVSAELNHIISGKQDGFLETLLFKFSRMCSAESLQEDMANLVTAAKINIKLLNNILFGVYVLILALLFYAECALFYPAITYIRQQKRQLDHMASTDPLTGQYNRVALFKVAGMIINGAKRHKHELTVLAIDIDDLKQINEKKGKAAGDAAIKAVAGALTGVLRNSDAMGRVGGEEFGVFLPSTDEYRASYVAEKLRKAVEELPFAVGTSNILLRVSIGIAQMQAAHNTPDDLLRTAELALQHAKNTGRNRVVTYSAYRAAMEQLQTAVPPVENQ